MTVSFLQAFLNRLTDLSTRNKALYLPKLEGNGFIDIRNFDFLVHGSSFELIRGLIEGKKELAIAPEFDPRSEESNQVSKQLSRIAFRDQLTQEDVGEQCMHIAWLFVEGKLINGQLLRSPVLLKPVRLQKKGGFWSLYPEGDWQFNPAFLLAWQHATHQPLSRDFGQEFLSNLPSDARVFRTELSHFLMDSFPIQLTSELMEDRVQAFPDTQVNLDREKFKEGKLLVKPYGVLGLFAQKESFLFTDYEHLIERYSGGSLEEFFQQSFATTNSAHPLREENQFPIFPLDASQEAAFHQIKEGNSLVVQGPPGSGKSQLIANLVSDYIARGKKVLLVSQKRAALEVVYERLKNQGLAPFLALVHDFKADQKPIFEKIRNQIESIEDYRSQINDFDSIQLEREISDLSKSINKHAETFEEFRAALFDKEPAGIPVKRLYLETNLQAASFLSRRLLDLNWYQAKSFERKFTIFQAYLAQFQNGFWENRKSFSRLESVEFHHLTMLLQELQKLHATSPSPADYSQMKDLVESARANSDLLENILALRDKFLAYFQPEQPVNAFVDPEQKEQLWKIQQQLRKLKERAASWKFDLGSDLAALMEEMDQLIPLSGTYFGRIKARWKRTSFPRSFEVLKKNGLALRPFILQEIVQECSTKIQVFRMDENLPDSLAYEPSGNLAKDLTTLSRILDLLESWYSLPEVHGLFSRELSTFSQFYERLDELAKWLSEFKKQQIAINTWLTKSQVAAVLEQGLPGVFNEPVLNWPAVFGDLRTFDQFLETWEFLDVGRDLVKNFPAKDVASRLANFWNGWKLAWLEAIEKRNPVLARAGTREWELEMEDLKWAILQKRKRVRHLALLRLKEQVASSLEYNRLGNQVTYRTLYHQVKKKRQRWSIRKLMQEEGDDLLRLLPCWMGSPEMVAAVFPSHQVFDLVIFDEASQCLVERGLPVMFRGKQVVVAGDSKQLPPSTFYQVKWLGEEEGLEFEAGSLLELASNFFKTMQLKGHYRSADPLLIDFSNRKFYMGKLEVLPDYTVFQKKSSPFTWEKVDGIWENQTNRVEAQAVLDWVLSIQRKNPEESIGIVTGNFFQMELIRELLFQSQSEVSSIRIRTIETVQGDEFDQVILSLGYGPNRAGKLVTNFGLLGKSGAENRLNVAITRARKQLHVISSLAPEDFRPSHLKNLGLALFQEYLSYVRSQAEKPSLVITESPHPKFEVTWSLKNKLLEESSTYTRQVPSSVMDLVENDGDSLKAILTDDQRFFDSPSAKAAMAYHPILLESKGWDWEWKWSRTEGLKS